MMSRLLLMLATCSIPIVLAHDPGVDAQEESDTGNVGEDDGESLDGGGPSVGAAQLLLSSVLDPLQEDRLFREADIGIQVVNATTGEEVYAHRADEAFVPASVMKAVTAAVALRTLGPAYRYTTALLTHEDNELDAEGTLLGDLYVWGGGDPSLVVEDLWAMARDLRLAGINTVEGDLIFDAEYFDQDYLIAGWRKREDLANGPAYFSPIGALTVNYNTTSLVVAPGPEAGEPARVQLATPTELVMITSEVVTGRPGSRPWMTIEREVDWQRGSMHFTMEGSIPEDETEPWRYYRSLPDPSLHFADVFRSMLTAQGIQIKGRNRLGKAPSRDLRVVISHKSEPLQVLLSTMNKRSSNIIAESVLKTIGAEVKGAPGTTAKGIEVVGEYLISLGIPAEEFTLINGSGLSREIQLRPSHVTAVLLDMLADEQHSPEYLSSLAIGGVDGTLSRRFTDKEHAGRVRGKTGSVNGVYCLAGIIDAGDGQRYVFSFFVNGYKRSSRPVRRLQDRFGVAILDLPAQNQGQ
ncbi:MAG: D-alanyl-D-alanine carboxypeptidase/D-alanyl-D-alanine-endopeptidase (penicillin-binding protein 4) [Myxococcota bacterium]|jgi:D-alanyl-D-alanine carboxypeptidase/D-alanyl-D-alanine-endopeptidase (penicillin-binding protein 4)